VFSNPCATNSRISGLTTATERKHLRHDQESKASRRILDAGDAVVDLDKPENIDSAINFLKNDAEPAIEGQTGDFNTLCI
jgi:hypothetical protein